MTASSDEPLEPGSSPPPISQPPIEDGLPQHPQGGFAAQLLRRRTLLAGAAGIGAIGVGAAIAKAVGGGGTTPVAGSTTATTTRPTTTHPRTTRPTSGTPTTTAVPTTSATTAATTAPATTSAAPTSSAPEPPPTSSEPAPPPTTTDPPPTTTAPPPPPPGEFLANTADVPLKGGVVVPNDGETVVTHPSGSTYFAFTAICTHQGCTVSQIAKNVITCFCHGSQYDAATGEVVTPPAPDPLAGKSIVVEDGKIYLV